RAGEADALPLPTTEPHSPVTHFAGVTLRKLIDNKVVDARHSTCRFDLGIGDHMFRQTKRNIFPDRGIKEKNRLGYITKIPLPSAYLRLPKLLSVDIKVSLAGSQQTH